MFPGGPAGAALAQHVSVSGHEGGVPGETSRGGKRTGVDGEVRQVCEFRQSPGLRPGSSGAQTALWVAPLEAGSWAFPGCSGRSWVRAPGPWNVPTLLSLCGTRPGAPAALDGPQERVAGVAPRPGTDPGERVRGSSREEPRGSGRGPKSTAHGSARVLFRNCPSLPACPFDIPLFKSERTMSSHASICLSDF